MDGLFNSFNMGNINANMNMAALFKNRDITPAVQKHLTKVYVSLVFCILAAVGGVAAHTRFGIGDGLLAPIVSGLRTAL
jgi:hypothetical protein